MLSRLAIALMVTLAITTYSESKTLSCNSWYYRSATCRNLNISPNDTLDIDKTVSTLSFYDSQVPELTSTLLSGLTNLGSLEIRTTNISEIEEGAFEDMTNLKRLYILNGKSLTNIKKDTFRGLSNLDDLKLTNMGIENIEDGAFEHVKSVNQLYIDQNSLSGSYVVGDYLKKVTYLVLAHNNLTHVVLKGLTKVETLKLHNNNFTIFHSDYFDDLTSLRNFYTAFNQIHFLFDDVFKNTIYLYEVDLSHNLIQSFSDRVFSHLSRLTYLYLNNNQITYIKENSFRNCTSMKLLRFWNNNIVYIEEGAFNGLTSLQSLELENNQLTVISDKQFSGTPQLKYLQLNGNKLVRLNVRKLLSDLKRLDRITIAENQWNCHDLLQLTEELQYSRINFGSGDEFHLSNVEGIGCSETSDQDTINAKNGVQSKVLEKYLKNDFPRSNFYRYFSDDYKNSALYKFFTTNYDNSAFTNYLQNDFKDSKFMKFFNGDFSHSNFFKYMNDDLKQKLRERLDIYRFSSDTVGSAKSEAEAMQLSDLQNSRNGFETFATVFVSVGVVLFGVILVFMVVLHRTIRELNF